jgi:galactose mutarotase-like enzyme
MSDGPTALVSIANELLELVVAPALGGRVVALRCRHHDRQWLAERPEGLERSAEDPAYGPLEAWGWDELFPSVLAGAAAPDPWPQPLRDHGELWGRPWRVGEHDEHSLALVYEHDSPGFTFGRRLDLEAGTVRCRYELTSHCAEPLPFQWSMHPIFALRPGERIAMSGIDRVRATAAGNRDLPEAPATLSWPRHEDLDLATVRASDGETILKLYAEAPSDGLVAIVGEPCELSIATDTSFAPDVGVYVNFGGWPPDGPLHHVGIEPTNAADDDLDAAIRAGRAGQLDPGEQLRWLVELRLGERCLVEPR